MEDKESSDEEKSYSEKSNELINNNDDYIDESKITTKRNPVLNDSLKKYEKKKKSNNLLESEEVFIRQRKEIEKIKQKNNLQNKNGYKGEEPKNVITVEPPNEVYITLNDYKYFEYSNIKGGNYEENKILKDVTWEKFNKSPIGNDQKGKFLINNKALLLTEEIDYSKKNLELKINCNLVRESEIWIFTRCFVNKKINNSLLFENNIQNIEENDYFNKYSSLIKIIKEIKDISENRYKYFITFGTFYHEENENNKLYYKSFLKRQLIGNSFDDVVSKIEIIIEDTGEEYINAKIYINNTLNYDFVSGKFFLPLNKKAKLLIYGKGKNIELEGLDINLKDKKGYQHQLPIKFESENGKGRNCDCCSVF